MSLIYYRESHHTPAILASVHTRCISSMDLDTRSSSLRRLAREVTARVLHLALSVAALGATPRLSPLILGSFSTVHRHVSLVRPIFLLPWGVHLRAVLVMELEGMRQTCRNHRHVSLGRPLFLLPWGVHLWAVLVMELEGMRQTCPNHRHHRVCIISARVSIPVLFLSSSLEMVTFQ